MGTGELVAERGLVGLRGVDASVLRGVLGRASVFAGGERDAWLGVCRGRTVANLFFEDSTRTRASFAVAAQRLGAGVLDLPEQGSSAAKGETLLDTALTLEAGGADALVVRAKPAGSAALVASRLSIPVINAGDGRHEHPTQGLLDCFTLARAAGREDFDLSGLRVAIVGDVVNSRVARSDVWAMRTLGAEVTLVGPPAFAPRSMGALGCGVEHDLDALIGEVDAVQVLRVQFERHGSAGVGISIGSFRERYAMTVERAGRMKPGAFVMHPGPANVGLEIDGGVMDGPRSLVRRQVRSGLFVRMAVLERAIGG